MLQKSWPLGRAKEKNWCAACSNIASDGLSPQCLIASPITAEFRFKSPGRTANAKKTTQVFFSNRNSQPNNYTTTGYPTPFDLVVLGNLDDGMLQGSFLDSIRVGPCGSQK